MKKKLIRLAAVSVMALSLSTGVAAANSGSIGTTGPHSYNKVEFRNRSTNKVENNNDVRVKNVNPQYARTGDASVRHNTTGGDATSGDAANDSLLRAAVRLDNSSATDAGCGCPSSNTGAISNTGPKSYNKVVFQDSSYAKVQNNNDVSVKNYNHQTAKSGDAKVSGNTTGGSATSGNASNISTNETTIEITN
jgi:hypothetical protein